MMSNQSKALADMSSLILKPLIAVLIRNKFSHSQLTELVRQSYVNVAYDEFSKSDQKMTYSKVASLTGLCRKEVVRLKTISRNIEQLSPLPSIEVMRVVHGWLSDENYLDSENQPIELRVDGSRQSFKSLVTKCCKDIPYLTVLRELTQAGLTSQNDLGEIRLNRTDYLLQQQEMEKIRIMSVCVSDMFSVAIESDKESDTDIRFHTQLVYSGINENHAREFHDIGSDKAEAFFKTLTEFLSSNRHDFDPELIGNAKRIGLGIYYFEGAKQIRSVKMTSENYA